jgi:NAD(P)-dependent dehydrogenase (short-subunit alcohol dehydrogenase family)
MKRLEGKVAVVVGTGSIPQGWGNGRATAVTFAREGAHVVCVDPNLDTAEETAEIIESVGGSALGLRADVTCEEDVAAVFARVATDHGRLDVLDNSVGISRLGGVVDTCVDDWDLVMSVNVTSAFLAMKHAVPLMQIGGGSIINISSVASIRYGGVPYVGYAASKAALNHLTRVTAAEYAPQQIRVNAILPGSMKTPLFQVSTEPGSTDGSGGIEEMWRTRDASVPMGHTGDGWDVANAALFFASDASRFVTGMELVVDGGVSLLAGPAMARS